MHPQTLIASLLPAALLAGGCDSGKSPDYAAQNRESQALLDELKTAYARIGSSTSDCFSQVEEAISKVPDKLLSRKASLAPKDVSRLGTALPFNLDAKTRKIVPVAEIEGLVASVYTSGEACTPTIEPLNDVLTELTSSAAYAYGDPVKIKAAIAEVQAAEGVATPEVIAARWRRCRIKGNIDYVTTTPSGDEYMSSAGIGAWDCELGVVWLDTANGEVLAAAGGRGKAKPKRRPSQGMKREIEEINRDTYNRALEAAYAQINERIARWPKS